MPRTTAGCLRLVLAPRPKGPAVEQRMAFFQESNISVSFVLKSSFDTCCNKNFNLCKRKLLAYRPKYLFIYRTLGPFFGSFKQAQ